MKRLKFLIVSLLIIGMMSACSTVSVSTDFDPSVDFMQLRTFNLGTNDRPGDALARDQLVQDRVFNAIKNTMQAKGFELVSTDPQMLVYAHAVTKEKTNVYSDPAYMGYGYGRWGMRGGYGWGGGVQVQNYTEGSLIIDVVDTTTNKMIWRGVGTAALSDPSTPEEKTKKINEAVAEILADFPPKKK